jgi:hypothetical protein
MRCSEPGHRASVAVHVSSGPGRWAWVVRRRSVGMKKRTITVSLAVALLAIGFLLLLRRYSERNPAGAPAGVLLSFHGLTNVPAKGDYALFSVTNAGSRRVSFDPDGLEYRDSRTWITNSLRNQRRDNWLYWDHNANGNVQLGKWDDFGGDLEPGASAMFGAPVLVTNAPWRLSFYCVEQAVGFRGVVDRTGDIAQRVSGVISNGAAGSQTTFSGRRYYLVSPEISK